MRAATERLIVAFDSDNLSQTLRMAKQLQGIVRYAKIGSILFTAAGPAAIQRVRALGFEVFLDLKFHDIPSTVEKSCRAAVHHRVWMLTVHASGQRQMLEAAADGARREASRLGLIPPRLVGVTVLTSVGAGRQVSVTRRVVALADEARRAGLDGVVASPHEAAAIRRRLGKQFVIVCPGIRPAEASAADQRRVSTPRDAISQGADYLVIGRPITEAKDPHVVVRRILAEMEVSCAC